MLFRLLTELKNRESIKSILCASAFPAYTLINAEGYWQGIGEQSLIIEIQTEDSSKNRQGILDLARAIGHANDQLMVLVQAIPLESHEVWLAKDSPEKQA